MNDNDARFDDMDLLQPHVRDRMANMLSDLEADFVKGRIGCQFRCFETYRSPVRQLALFRLGRSKAPPYRSAHQFGLAADIVPWQLNPATGRGQWTWEPADHNAWSFLRAAALRHGLDAPISWDRAHVQHSGLWARLQTALNA